MNGETMLVNGDRWTIVDTAPGPELAEMVAVILEEEGFPVMTRGASIVGDALTHMGTASLNTTYVLVPEADADRALTLIAETVTDYEGDDLDALLEELASQGEADTAITDDPDDN